MMMQYYNGWEIFYNHAAQTYNASKINEERITAPRLSIEEVYRDIASCDGEVK